MKGKTKAILAVIIAALCVLGYFFINTTAAIERTFNKIGRIAVVVLVIAVAVAAIIFISKLKTAKNEHDVKKAAKKEAKVQKPQHSEPDVLEAEYKAATAETAAPAETVYTPTDIKEDADTL